MHRFEGVTTPIDEEAPRSIVDPRVSSVWACRAFSMGPRRQAARMPQVVETPKSSPVEGRPCTVSRGLDRPNSWQP